LVKHLLSTVACLSVCAGAASAGGIDRSGQGIGALFEPGRYAELSFGFGSPDVSGTAPAAFGGAGSGDMSPSYLTFGAAYKQDFGDKVSVALIFDQPFGADVDYPTGTGYPFAGSTAELRTNAISAIGRYKFSDRFSVHAGLRYQTLEGSIDLISPALPAPFSLEADRDGQLGYLVGVAYEIPEIALRAALTYYSKIDYTLETQEGIGVVGPNELDTSTPEAVNLDFQTGIAEDTLLTAAVRWVNWPQFDVSPVTFPAALNPLVSYSDPRTTYSLGIARRFNESFAGSLSVSYEETIGKPVTNLGPTDGLWSVTVGGVYTRDNMKVTAGVRYAMVGDATTRNIGADFSDNHAIGIGLKVGYSF
jgi:long-chain fatty acid transport protein